MKKNATLKKMMTGILAMGLLAGCAAGGTAEPASTAAATEESAAPEVVETNATVENETVESTDAKDGKTLVVYYSAQGHTVNFANAIAEELNGDLFELVPVEVYTEEDLNWMNSDSRVSREHDDTSLRDIALVSTEVENWEEYDTVYIGYPIWWGIAAWPVDNFVKNNDFTGKTVIPFATSSSSGMGESGTILEGYAGSGNWLEGKRFQSNESVDHAKEWAAGLQK